MKLKGARRDGSPASPLAYQLLIKDANRPDDLSQLPADVNIPDNGATGVSGGAPRHHAQHLLESFSITKKAKGSHRSYVACFTVLLRGDPQIKEKKKRAETLGTKPAQRPSPLIFPHPHQAHGSVLHKE